VDAGSDATHQQFGGMLMGFREGLTHPTRSGCLVSAYCSTPGEMMLGSVTCPAKQSATNAADQANGTPNHPR